MSEIAEKAAREIAKLATGWDYSDVPDLFEEEILKHVERAIAESQGIDAVMEFCARHTAGSPRFR